MKIACPAALCFSMLFLASCATREPIKVEVSGRDTVTQLSTFQAFNGGDCEGLVRATDLPGLGNFGLGVFHGLEGVLVMASGAVFRAKTDGALRAVDEGDVLTFATCCFLQPDVAFDTGPMSLPVFEKTMDWKRKGNRLVHAYRVTGTFRSVQVKSTAKVRRPCPPWAQSWAQAPLSTASNINGTVLGFWFPGSLGELTGGGYRLGFVDDRQQFGGWVEDFQLERGRIEIDLLPAIRTVLGPEPLSLAP